MAEEGNEVSRCRHRFKNVMRAMKRRINDSQDSSLNCTGEADCDCSGCRRQDLLDNRMNIGDGPITRGGKLRLNKSGSSSAADSRRTNFTLRLFDRVVDLSPFQESTPLYTICRDWVKNKPKRDGDDRRSGIVRENAERTEDADESQKGNNICELPPPKPLLQHNGAHRSMMSTGRVPYPLPRAEDKSVWSYIQCHSSDDHGSLPSPAALFQNHLDRWTLIKQRWKKQCVRNEERFEASFKILHKLHVDVEASPSAQSEPMQNN